MKRSLDIKILCFVVFLAVACEFRLPPEPSLPSSWEIRVLFPFYKKAYTVGELFGKNNFVADSSGFMNFLWEDSIAVSDFPDSFWVVYLSPIRDSFKIGEMRIQRYGDTTRLVKSYFLPVSQGKCRVKSGVLSDGLDGYNSIKFRVNFGIPVGDSILIDVVGCNVVGTSGDTILHRHVIEEGSMVDSFVVSLEGDSVFIFRSQGYLESIKLNLAFSVMDIPAEAYDIQIDAEIIPEPLDFERFVGSVAVRDTFLVPFLDNSPDPMGVVRFNDVSAYMVVSGNTGGVSRFEVSGFSVEEGWLKVNERYYEIGDTLDIDVDSIVGLLPDSLGIVVDTYSKENVFYRGVLLSRLPIGLKLVIDVPFCFTISDTLSVVGGKVTTFEVRDSTARKEALEKQKGAKLELSLSNETPLMGQIVMLHSSVDISRWDSLFVADSSFLNDSAFVDTIAVVYLDSTVSYSEYFIDSTLTRRLLIDCPHYILPCFVFFPTDSAGVRLNASQSIRIDSYLRIFLNPDKVVE
ncbi:MAG: hypothetical protein DRP92_02955 [Candidatus Neomarinimicrobiota bacterium]|nr:MAG: hypothetical protein DRP92_02955 [Candidatus Neomarinimicrobiota bacterium]